MIWRQARRKRYGNVPEGTWIAAASLLFDELDGRLRTLAALGVLTVLTASAAAALAPALFKVLIDELSGQNSAWQGYLTIPVLVASYATVHLIARATAELRSLIIGRIDERLHLHLSLRMSRHIMALPIRFHLGKQSGGLIQILSNGLVGYRLVSQHLVVTILPAVIEIGTMSIVLLLLDQSIFLYIIVISLLCYLVAFAVSTSTLTQPARNISASSVSATSLLSDSIANYETVKLFGAEGLIDGRMSGAFTATEAYWAQFLRRKALTGITVVSIFSFSLGTCAYVASNRLLDGRMNLGDFVLVNAYLVQAFRPVEMLGFAFLDIARGMAFIEKLIAVLREEPEARDGVDDAPPSTTGPAELLFDGVYFSYERTNPLLKNVSFRVRPGTIVAIVGASGSGKSSLIRLLVRFWEPDSGRILLDGAPISRMSRANLRSAIAVVPQDPILFNDSIAFNIAIGRAGSSAADIESAAQIAGIHEFIVAQRDGYKTLVGDRGMKLSGGERQRIAIARAALRRPRIYVFDEATSSLDSITERRVLRNLGCVAEGTTSLVIAHRLSSIVDADSILVLEGGSLVESGTHQELILFGGAYHAMWEAQHRIR